MHVSTPVGSEQSLLGVRITLPPPKTRRRCRRLISAGSHGPFPGHSARDHCISMTLMNSGVLSVIEDAGVRIHVCCLPYQPVRLSTMVLTRGGGETAPQIWPSEPNQPSNLQRSADILQAESPVPLSDGHPPDNHPPVADTSPLVLPPDQGLPADVENTDEDEFVSPAPGSVDGDEESVNTEHSSSDDESSDDLTTVPPDIQEFLTSQKDPRVSKSALTKRRSTFLKWFEAGLTFNADGVAIPIVVKNFESSKVPESMKNADVVENKEPCSHCRPLIRHGLDSDFRAVCLVPDASVRKSNQGCILCSILGYTCSSKPPKAINQASQAPRATEGDPDSEQDELAEFDNEDELAAHGVELLNELRELEEFALDTIQSWSARMAFAPKAFRRLSSFKVSTCISAWWQVYPC